MKHSLKRVLSWMLVVCMVLSFVPAAGAASVTWKETDIKITAELSDRQVKNDKTAERDASEMVRVSIVLEKASTVEAGYATMGIAANTEAMSYRAQLLATQKRMEKTISARALDGKPLDVVWNMTLVGNIISAWVPYGSLEKIAAIPGVKSVTEEAQYEPAVAERQEGAVPNTYPSSSMIGSGVLWNGGYTGAGTRIAIVDTGTDTDHQSFDNGAYLQALAENAADKGMSLAEYKASLDLMDKDDIAAVLPELHASERMKGVTAEDLYLNEKLAFGFNYVDGDLTIVHDYDQQGEHGSHVAGISTANRLIPTDGGYADATETVMMLGVAPDAQLITMKVFGESFPYDSDYMAAIEDAIMLDCDVVNLSMGTTMPGSPYTETFSDLMEMMERTDTVVVISAGNASNWPVASLFGYLYHDDVSFDTVGAPGSYANAFTVASVENDGTVGSYFTAAGKRRFYYENLGYGNTAFAGLDTSADLSGTEYEYVLLDGLGGEEEYAGLDVSGKVVLVSRGTLNFAVKANNAAARGAVAVLVYNNTDGMFGMDLTGLDYAIPVASLLLTDAQAIMEASTKVNEIAYTGKLTVSGKPGVGQYNSEYYTMSDFSSWGVPSSLTLKPEITAPGGEIRSLWGSNAVTGGGSDLYETMSGTSMAAPQVTGMVALMAQYYRENGLAEKSGISARHLAQSLLMSTAQPLFEEASDGNYYSLMNQGAGLARVDLASQADSFIKVAGQEDYKVKAELGDDPQRTGVYEFDFTITNLTDSARVYSLDADLFRQDVFEYQPDSEIFLLDTWTTGLDASVTFSGAAVTGGAAENHDVNGDGTTNADDADFLLEYTIGNETTLHADGDLDDDGTVDTYDAHLLLASLQGDTVMVPANESVTVRVRMALTAEAKAELDAETPKGTYVEAFVYVRGTADAEGEAGTTHSIPVLAFYGDWSEPSMFDRGTLMDLVYMNTNTAPYLYQIVGPYGNALGIDFGDGTEYYYGGNPIMDDEAYLPERNAFNSEDASVITEQGYTLIRGAGAGRIQVTNAETGEIYLEKNLGELYPAYYDPSAGGWGNAIQYARLNWTGKDASGDPLAEGTQVNVTMTAIPHYYRQADGSFSFEDLGAGTSMTTSFTIDNTAPEATDIDLSRLDADKLVIKAKDNRYVAAVGLLNAKGTKALRMVSPNQTEKGAEVTVEMDLTEVYGNNFLVAVFDYAQNMTVYEVELNLGSPERHYFTAIDYNTMSYVSVDMSGQTALIADTGLPVLARAAEYVGGYVFTVTADNSLCVANDEDLTITERICKLDPYGELLITGVNDLAYNYADGQLYIQFYSQYNYESAPYLATVDMSDGSLEVVCELPTDVNTMAIATDGTFYSAGYGANILYKYTLEDILSGNGMTVVGEMGYYYSAYLSSMAWDHNTGKLYWAFPNTLVEINPETAEPTLLGYHEAMLVGLYTRPDYDEGMFDPVDTVDRLELSLYDTRVMLNATLALEATVWPWNASDRTVTWTSSDESVATVDANGVVTGRKEGKCTITVTSNLDSTVTETCEIEVFRMEKTLNGLVWDEQGEIWMSEFSTATIPEYTKLSDANLGHDLAAATVDEDGDIYAASLDVNTLKSTLYKLDSTTFEPVKIGASADGYVDLAPAPGQGEDRLMAAYGGNILNVDAATGDYYNHYYMFSYNLVALAYVGTMPYTDWGYNTTVDWYFIIDRVGYVYLMGFLEQDGSYLYVEHDSLAPGGVYTQIPFEMDTGYFGSAYFDGEFLYYSAYKESKNNVTLMAIDVAGGSKACYELGTFADGVWPVAGLMELDGFENHIDVIMGTETVETMSQPIPVEPQAELKGIREEKTQGTLNTANAIAPLSNAEIKNDIITVDVTIPDAAANGFLSVSYDPELLEVVDVVGKTEAFAWNDNDSYVRLAFAEAAALPEDTTVATLRLRMKGEGKTELSVVTWELNDNTDPLYYDTEVISVDLPHNCPSARFDDVKQSHWFHEAVDFVVEAGWMNGLSDTKFGPNDTMNRAQFVTVLYRMEGEPAVRNTGVFEDVGDDEYYTNAVYWALKSGITTGTSETAFEPYGLLSRSQLVTFMYRYAKYKGYDVSANADLSAYRDASLIQDYALDAWKWSITNGIVNGYSADTLAPTDLTNRSQAAAIFQRFALNIMN